MWLTSSHSFLHRHRITATVAVLLIFVLELTSTASAQTIQYRVSDFVVFGKNSVTYQGFTTSTGAPVGTNGDLNHLAGVGTFTSLHGGGVLNGANTNARQRVVDGTVPGDVRINFNGDIRINELSRVNGSVHTHGNLNFEAGATGDGIQGGVAATGSVTIGAFNEVFVMGANGDVFLGPSARVVGSMGSGGDVSLDIGAKVGGHVRYRGTLTVAPLAMVGSSSRGGVHRPS